MATWGATAQQLLAPSNLVTSTDAEQGAREVRNCGHATDRQCLTGATLTRGTAQRTPTYADNACRCSRASPPGVGSDGIR